MYSRNPVPGNPAFTSPRGRTVRTQIAALAAVAALACSAARANPQSDAPAASGSEAAVWVSRQLNFPYRQFTTRYTCDGLQDKVREDLFKLGAREVQVRAYGCTRLIGADPFAGVSIWMKVLQPAPAHSAQTVPAHWKKVDLLADIYDQDPVDAAADCELTQQFREKVLPLFTTRNLDYSARCEPHNLLIGATRLKVEVLVTDTGATADSGARSTRR